jgi:hypothetical protein
MFDVKWYRLQMHERDEERIFFQHSNGFPMIKTTMFETRHDHYVFPSQCEHVFYSKVPGERDWSFVVRYDPRGRPIKYIVEEEDYIEEEYDVPETEQEHGSTNEEDKEYEPGVGDNAVLDDDVNEYMLENDIDEDDDNINPFNTIYEPDDDIDIELDEEEDIERMIQMLSWMRYVTIYFNLSEILSLNNLLMWVNYMFLSFMPFLYILCSMLFIMSNLKIVSIAYVLN